MLNEDIEVSRIAIAICYLAYKHLVVINPPLK